MNYDEFIQSIIDSRGQWGIPKNEYKEGHHIVPRCLGGEGVPSKKDPNIIWLYPKEHYIAHKLLLEKYPHNSSIAFAFSMMAFPKGKTSRENMLTAEEYEEARLLFSKSVSGTNNPCYGKPAWNKGIPMSEERKQYMKHVMAGSRKGIPKSEETKSKMREAAKTIDHSKNGKDVYKDSRCITNGKIYKYIKNGEDLEEGYWFEGANKNVSKDMSKYYMNEEARKRHSERCSGKKNPNYGNHKMAGGNNSTAIYRYFFLEKTFECRVDLLRYLKQNGFPDISDNALRSIQNNTYKDRTRRKFSFVIDNLSWELKEDKVLRWKLDQ